MCSRSERLGKERLGVEMLSLEVGVENHREIADKDAAEPCGANFVVRKKNQAVGARNIESFELRREVSVEIDAKFRIHLFFRYHRMAKKADDHRAANMVVGGKMVAAHGCKAAIVNRVL